MLFAAILSALVLAVLVMLPLTELSLTRAAHAELYGLETEPVTIRTNGMGTVFLMMEFVRLEEREVAERALAERYVEGDALPLHAPLFELPLFAPLPAANDQRAA
ncbi:MAG: hypothetical protein P1P90_01320 [Patescibacteria group bacterium]|nr:hypothetical protein [Patescibacteria group bacterium]